MTIALSVKLDRAEAIIALLRTGKTLAEIGAAHEPPVTREYIRRIATGSADYWDALAEGQRMRSAATLAASPFRCACGNPIAMTNSRWRNVRCQECIATGRPCKCGCGKTAKFSFASRECKQGYYNNLPERKAAWAAYGVKWIAEHPLEYKAINARAIRKWQAKNPDKVKIYSRIDYTRHRDKRLAYQRAYYARKKAEREAAR